MPHFPFSLHHLSLLTLVVLGLHLPNKVLALSRVQFFATPWIVARQSSLSMEFFQARILEWAAISSPGDLPNPGIKPVSPALAGAFFTTCKAHQALGQGLWEVSDAER